MTTKQTTGGELIYELMPKIMAEVPSIAKDRKNAQQGYGFRGIDDVYNALNGILAKHQVFMSAEVLKVDREERPSKSGGIMAFVQVHVRYRFIAPDGSWVTTDALGEGMDSGDKATPKAMSVAQKYALFQAFLIPTADPKDVENDNPEPAPKPKPARTTAAPLTEIQRLSIAKIVDDMQTAGKDPEVAIGKLRDYYAERGVTIDNFPTDLTFEQAEAVIKSWSAAMKPGAKK